MAFQTHHSIHHTQIQKHFTKGSQSFFQHTPDGQGSHVCDAPFGEGRLHFRLQAIESFVSKLLYILVSTRFAMGGDIKAVAHLRALGHKVIHKPKGVKTIIDGKTRMRFPDIAVIDDFGTILYYIEVKSGSSRYLRRQRLRDEIIFQTWGIQTRIYRVP